MSDRFSNSHNAALLGIELHYHFENFELSRDCRRFDVCVADCAILFPEAEDNYERADDDSGEGDKEAKRNKVDIVGEVLWMYPGWSTAHSILFWIKYLIEY